MNINYVSKVEKGNKYEVCQDYLRTPAMSDIYDEKKGMLFAVCDGVGGYPSGNVASKLTIKWLFDNFYLNNTAENDSAWLRNEIKHINRSLFDYAERFHEHQNMATTLVCLLIKDKQAVIFNVGDSRLYLYLNSKLIQITKDHSCVWERYEKGQITKDEIINQPDKNYLTQCLGGQKLQRVEISEFSLEIPEKFIFLLCTDGLTDVMTDSSLEEIIRKGKDLTTIANESFQKAVKNGTDDDVSFILISDYLPVSR